MTKRTLKLAAALLIALTGLVVLVPAQASAGHGGGHCVSACSGGGGGTTPSTAFARAYTAGAPHQAPSNVNPRSGGGVNPCWRFEVVPANEEWFGAVGYDSPGMPDRTTFWEVWNGVLPPDPEERHAVWCGSGAGILPFIYVASGLPAPANIAALVQETFDEVPVESFDPYAAPVGSPDIFHITQAESFFWVDPAEWGPVSAQAAVPNLTVTTTATPIGVVWTGFDEPDSFACTAAQATTAWARGAPTDCAGTFTQATPGTSRVIRMTVEWEVIVTCVPAVCPPPPSDRLYTASDVTVNVGEVQAIEDSGE